MITPHHRGNRWVFTVSIPAPGGRRRRYYSCRTEGEANRLIVAVLGQLHAGTLTAPTRLTLAEFSARWLDHVKGKVRPTTYAQYEQMTRLHILPVLGGFRLTVIAPLHIQGLYDELAQRLSPKSVHHVHTVLRAMLNQAVRWQVLARNPATAADPPKLRPANPRVWTREQVVQFLAAAVGHDLYAAFHLALTCGLRRGEILGLKWDDLDLDAGLLRVRRSLVPVDHKLSIQETKTPASVRTLPLAPETVAVLRRHRVNQAEWRLVSGRGATEWLFRSVNDNPQDPTALTRRFGEAAVQTGLPRITLHACRHTYASMLADAGVHPKIAMQLLGHAALPMTFHYSHGSERAMQEAQLAVSGAAPARRGVPGPELPDAL